MAYTVSTPAFHGFSVVRFGLKFHLMKVENCDNCADYHGEDGPEEDKVEHLILGGAGGEQPVADLTEEYQSSSILNRLFTQLRTSLHSLNSIWVCQK